MVRNRVFLRVLPFIFIFGTRKRVKKGWKHLYNIFLFLIINPKKNMFVKVIVFVNFFMHLLNGTLDGNIFIEMDGDCHFQETLYAVLFNQHFDKCLYIYASVILFLI